MRQFFYIIFVFLFLKTVYSYGQANAIISESLTTVSDSLMKIEVSSFTLKGSTLKKIDSLRKTLLIEIPISYCTDKVVLLSKSKFFGSIGTYINIYFNGDLTNRTLDSIFLVTHSHLWVRIPKDAYKGILSFYKCNFNSSKKQKEHFSSFLKAFYSKDYKRLYIYMLCGKESSKYEVTWVIINDDYLKRIVDYDL